VFKAGFLELKKGLAAGKTPSCSQKISVFIFLV
jgi:hypothetical protein